MNRKQIATIVFAVLFFIGGFLVLLQQYLVFGVWFQITDIHHETIALSAFTLAIGMLIGVASGLNRKK